MVLGGIAVSLFFDVCVSQEFLSLTGNNRFRSSQLMISGGTMAASVLKLIINNLKKNKLELKLNSIRTFIGSKDFKISQSFYKELGFQERKISENMSLFTKDALSFYLQDYFVEEWLSNSMLLIEVADVAAYWSFITHLELDTNYSGCKLIPIQEYDWGKQFQLIDPSGVLWHFTKFN